MIYNNFQFLFSERLGPWLLAKWHIPMRHDWDGKDCHSQGIALAARSVVAYPRAGGCPVLSAMSGCAATQVLLRSRQTARLQHGAIAGEAVEIHAWRYSRHIDVRDFILQGDLLQLVAHRVDQLPFIACMVPHLPQVQDDCAAKRIGVDFQWIACGCKRQHFYFGHSGIAVLIDLLQSVIIVADRRGLIDIYFTPPQFVISRIAEI